mmetsp:Transcript_43095/g.106371  ORF Transcript_43095/g.106371 Transcript_43095/m.106371 type:complete len:293 (+) Transcript_43095:567-1445(+)
MRRLWRGAAGRRVRFAWLPAAARWSRARAGDWPPGHLRPLPRAAAPEFGGQGGARGSLHRAQAEPALLRGPARGLSARPRRSLSVGRHCAGQRGLRRGGVPGRPLRRGGLAAALATAARGRHAAHPRRKQGGRAPERHEPRARREVAAAGLSRAAGRHRAGGGAPHLGQHGQGYRQARRLSAALGVAQAPVRRRVRGGRRQRGQVLLHQRDDLAKHKQEAKARRGRQGRRVSRRARACRPARRAGRALRRGGGGGGHRGGGRAPAEQRREGGARPPDRAAAADGIAPAGHHA